VVVGRRARHPRVAVVEEADIGDADSGGGGAQLFFPHRAEDLGVVEVRHRGVAHLAAGSTDEGDVGTGVGGGGHYSGAAERFVVRVAKISRSGSKRSSVERSATGSTSERVGIRAAAGPARCRG
jgi:hypothetical protein